MKYSHVPVNCPEGAIVESNELNGWKGKIVYGKVIYNPIPENLLSLDIYPVSMIDRTNVLEVRNSKIVCRNGRPVEEGILITRDTLVTKEDKDKKRAEIASSRYDFEVGGLEVNGMQIKTDRVSQAMINAANTLLSLDNTRVVKWKKEDGTFVELDINMIRFLVVTVGSHIQDCFSKECDLNLLIDSAVTFGDLENIIWT